MIVDSSCPPTTEESTTFIEKMKLDFRVMVKIATPQVETLVENGHDMNMKPPAGIIHVKKRSIRHAKERTYGSAR